MLAAMLVETLMSLATPWPLKVVLDNVVGGNRLPQWLRGFRWDPAWRRQDANRAFLAAVGFVAIAAYRSRALPISIATSARACRKAWRTICACALITICSASRSPITTTQGGSIAQHAHLRHRHHSELRLLRNTGNSGRHPRRLRNVPADVLAELGLRPAGRGSRAFSALVRFQARKTLKNATKLVRGNESEMVARGDSRPGIAACRGGVRRAGTGRGAPESA